MKVYTYTVTLFNGEYKNVNSSGKNQKESLMKLISSDYCKEEVSMIVCNGELGELHL